MTDGMDYGARYGDVAAGGLPRVLGGRYDLGEEIGRGGMAEVYAGRDTRLGRTVAVKVLKSELARDPAFQSRFKREAQSAASLNHPAIVAVYDTGDEQIAAAGGGTSHLPYIVMEYLQGRTVKDVLAQHGRLSVDDSLRVTAGVLDALQYSHRNGIVHRDIKPANVMVTDAGEIKVMDFGIARAIADTGATMTGTNAVLGTAQYLSPEQAKGETVDNRSDLYSTACLLYELLTGRPPFVGDSPVSLAYQHVGEQPQLPSVIVPDLPPDLDRVVMRGLSKDRETRYQSAEDFIDDLDRVATGKPVTGGDTTQVVGPAAAAAAGAAAGGLAGAGATQRMGATEQAAAWPATSTPRQGYGAGGYDDTGYPTPGSEYPAYGDYRDDEQPRRSLRWLWITLAVLAVVALGGILLFLNSGGGDDPSATPTGNPTTQAATAGTLPSVVGQSFDEARQALTEAGFTNIQRSDQETVNEDEVDQVLGQQPEGGTDTPVAFDTQVTLTVGTLPGEVEVPDVRGLSQTDARAQIEGAGLVWGEIRQEDDPEIPSGAVVRTEPEASSRQSPGTTVNVFVSSGEVEVPDVVGSSINEATQLLSERGLNVQQTSRPDPAEPGTVLEQSPSSGSSASPGDTVQLIVASPQATVTQTPTPTTPTETPPPTDETPPPTDDS